MKKLFTTSAICFLLATAASGQKLRKKQAEEILQTAITSLKNADSAAFVRLWHFDGTAAPYHQKPFTEKTALSYFHYLREFIDTALIKNLPVEDLEISKVDAGQEALNFGKYNVKVWFKYTDKYSKGFGFFLDYIDDKWVVRYIPDTSVMTRS